MAYNVNLNKRRIHHALILCVFMFNVSINAISLEKEDQGLWEKTKKILVSESAKAVYGLVMTGLLVRYGAMRIKKISLEREHAKRLRNGKIVFSWLVEQNYSSACEGLRWRYMQEYTNCYFDIPTKDHEIIITDRNPLTKSSLLHKIYRDIEDMNSYSASIGKLTNWEVAMKEREIPAITILPLKEDFDVPRHQVVIKIPNNKK